MAINGQQYDKAVPWILRIVVGSAIIALIIGWIVGKIIHQSPFWKIDGIIFAVLIGIEIVFRILQRKSEN